MPVVLALLAVLASFLVPATVAAHDLEPTTATPDVVVEIGSSVSPREVRVPAGSVVGWVNRDDDRHRVRSRSGPAAFDSGNLERGERFAVRLTTPGTYAYADDRDRDDGSYHGRIVVTAATESGGSTGGTGGGPAAGAPQTALDASIGDRVFSPATIEVAVGGTVTWTNDDDREHTVTASDGAFDSGVLDAGGTFEQRFPTAGTFPFLCALHPEMQGEVRVAGGGATATPGPAAEASPPPSPAPTPRPSAVAPVSPHVVTIEMRDFAFGPTDVEIAAGGTVAFANVGQAPHTATAADGTFDTELVASGASSPVTIVAPGSYAFACAFHPEMTGTIEVLAAPSPEATPSPEPTTAVVAPPSASPTRGAQATEPAVEAAAPASDASLAGMGGLVLAMALIGTAGALFAKVVQGSARPRG